MSGWVALVSYKVTPEKDIGSDSEWDGGLEKLLGPLDLATN